jgi:RNA polymerase sigma-70 factor (ECF subfamily)
MAKTDLTQLAIQAKAGNREAFGELYDATFDLIYKFFAFRVHDPEDANDLTSQVYLEAWQNLSRFDTKRSFSAWIFGFAKFRLIDYYRAHRITASLDAVTNKASTTDLQAETASNLENQRIKAGLNQLAEPYQTVIQLKYLQELEYSEMAKILGKTESHLRVLVKRGLDRLRLIIE